MPSHQTTVTPTSGSSKKAPAAARFLQAAALAAVLVPLGSVTAETAIINCVTSVSGEACSGTGTGDYTRGGGFQSNIWQFYPNDQYLPEELIYTFEVGGAPTTSFGLRVHDYVTTQSSLLGGGFLANFPDLTCVPTFAEGRCGLFDVTVIDPPAEWEDGYRVTIVWWPNGDPLSRPPQGSFVTILQAKDGTGGVFGNTLEDIWYDEFAVPGGLDPAIGGRGDGFSRFGVFAGPGSPVPEPASVLLLGTGLAGALYRVRRRKRQP